MRWFVSHLIYLSLTKPQCSNVFIQVRNICFASTSHLVLLDILFILLKVKLGTLLPIHRCAFWFNLKYIFVSLCKYSRTLSVEWNFWHGAELLVRPGFSDRAGLELKFVKIFRACIQNFFITLGVMIFFFPDVDLLCSPR